MSLPPQARKSSNEVLFNRNPSSHFTHQISQESGTFACPLFFIEIIRILMYSENIIYTHLIVGLRPIGIPARHRSRSGEAGGLE
jgi:hypothetical protein